jgi:non-ribosomal peptide synthetase-like protein
MNTPLEVTPAQPAAPASVREHVTPSTPTERLLCEVLTDIVHAERVSVESNFFDDLGADSMVMAHFCARVRKRGDLPPVSMKEIYRNPTIRRLAAAITVAAPAPAPASVSSPAAVATPIEAGPRARTWQVALCGALQVLSALAYLYLVAVVLARGTNWASRGSGFVEDYARSALVTWGEFLGVCLLPILAKWVLVGRWTSQRIRIWSLGYVRFWLVKTLIRMNPLVLFAGTPIYVLYLRALGARIGRGAVIHSPHVPVCTDLLTIGDHAVVRKESYFTCYRARAGYIETGPVSIGKDAYVGEMTVLDIDTSLGNGAQLGHSSSLYAGQAVPDGEHRQGSPARERTRVDYRSVPPARCSAVRKITFSIVDLLLMLLFLPLLSATTLNAELPQLTAPTREAFSQWMFYRETLVGSFVLYFGGALVTLAVVVTVPRLLNLALEPNRVYPLYGFHYWAQRAIERVSNFKFFPQLFGDSSYIVHYLQWIGYDLSRVVQTGSNFGVMVKHDNPFLVTVGSGTMVADGLAMINADYSSTSFRLSRVSIGPDNFIGNLVAYPSQGRTGANCLLATMVMVPVEGDVREGTGLLGSPSFEIPRSVLRDSQFDHLSSASELPRRLAAKNRHNLVTMGLFLFVHWMHLFALLLLARGVLHLHGLFGASVIALAVVGALVFTVVYYALVERVYTLFRPLQPRHCSIYHPDFWFHERYWKLMGANVRLFDGTPFKPLVWRLLGVRIGKRVFDDGCAIVERALVSVGDDVTPNEASLMRPHSQEDGGFKSDRIVIGAGCTIGLGALVHYGVTMGDGAELLPQGFLMKGEDVPAHSRWGENPAREIRDDPAYGAAMAVAARPALAMANGHAASLNGGHAA